ncbi:MAG: phosphoglycerate kinase [Candidatus Dormibacteraeota bacterium]|nr:phosphoglycerate kinase [Candidatus Dormibacteraeota bacterium]
MGRKAGLDEIDARGKRVFLRVDFNVPLREDRRIRDDARMRAALPTIRELVADRAAVIVATHLGRPKGQVLPALSTRPLAEHLGLLLGAEVTWVPDCVGPEVEDAATTLRPGQVMMLENLRFHPEEEANHPAFARSLARLANLYVNDAFGTAHRAHASTEGIAHYLPAYAGRLMARELAQLGGILDNPTRPLVAIMGGSKLSTKLGVINHLLPRLDDLCLGGAMAATFLRAQGLSVGKSLVEDEFVAQAAEILSRASRGPAKVELPSDVVVAPSPDAAADQVRQCPVGDIGSQEMILDVGPATVNGWARLVATAGTVVWNGPLGVYENPLFAGGTRELAQAIAASSAVSVTGGGDLQAAIDGMGLTSGFTHVSTGGGATLEFLEGRELPGVAVLMDAAGGE